MIRLERKGHKTGYALADAYGEFPPPTAGIGSGMMKPREWSSQAQEERKRLQTAGYKPPLESGPLRGFPEGYEDAPLEAFNDRLDLTKLHAFLKGEGVSVGVLCPMFLATKADI